MIAHTLGNPFDLSVVKDFCDKHNLWLVEDNCDALGSKYIIGEQEYYTGTIGDIGTSSFYPPHHMTMGEGGCVYTNNPLLNRLIKVIETGVEIVYVHQVKIIIVNIVLMDNMDYYQKDMIINMYIVILAII